jgi:hypothetical protein
MAANPGAVYDRVTQVLCYALSDDPGLERQAQEAAGRALAGFEHAIRSVLTGHEYAEDLDKADYARLMYLMRP